MSYRRRRRRPPGYRRVLSVAVFATPAVVSAVWLLVSGFWDDNGIWDDNATWNG